MLATLVDEPFSNEHWLFEIKWDGYRAVAYMDYNYFELLSRNNLSFLEKYNPVADALKVLGIRAVLDGEIVAVDEKGLGNFQLLQNWQTTPHVFLKKLHSVNAIRMAMQGLRTVFHIRQNVRSNLRIVIEHITFGDAFFLPI